MARLCPRCRKPTLRETAPELRHTLQWDAAGEEVCSHARVRRQSCQDGACGYQAVRASLLKVHPYCKRLRPSSPIRSGRAQPDI